MNEFKFTDTIHLENDRVYMEPLGLKHNDLLKGIIARDTGLLIYSSIKVETADDLEQYILTAMTGREEKTRYAFAIFDKQANRWAGSTSFANLSNRDGRVEIGYTWIGRDFQRTGLNSAMKYVMLKYIFETLGFYRAELRADSRNSQSRTAIQRIGATYEGELRGHMLLPDGYRRDTVCYSILAGEWPKIRSERFGA